MTNDTIEITETKEVKTERSISVVSCNECGVIVDAEDEEFIQDEREYYQLLINPKIERYENTFDYETFEQALKGTLLFRDKYGELNMAGSRSNVSALSTEAYVDYYLKNKGRMSYVGRYGTSIRKEDIENAAIGAIESEIDLSASCDRIICSECAFDHGVSIDTEPHNRLTVTDRHSGDETHVEAEITRESSPSVFSLPSTIIGDIIEPGVFLMYAGIVTLLLAGGWITPIVAIPMLALLAIAIAAHSILTE